jgi:anthranilate synthase component 2
VPLFGVCLGHQTIGEAFGGRSCAIPRSCMASWADHPPGQGRVRRPALPLRATRYHSLWWSATACPTELEITAELEDGTIMGLRHRTAPIEGVQFHPESIRSEHGHALLKNFLDPCAEAVPA